MVKIKRKAGQSIVEYILIVALILVAMMLALPAFKTTVQTKVFDTAKSQIDKAGDKWKTLQ